MTKICKYCGREFEPNAPQRVYCSDRCRRASCDTKYKRRKKMSPLDQDVYIMSVCGIQYRQLQAYRQQGLTDNDILKRHVGQKKVR